MNGIKVNVNNQNGGQHNDYMSILSNNDNNNYLLDFEHISNDVFEANIKPCLKQLRCVINELIDSESVYLKSLCDIEEGYLLRLKENDIGVNSQLLDVLFYKIPDLRVFHAQLHTDLQLGRDNLIQLGQVFLDNAKQFEELYVEFCLNYPKSIHLLEEEQKSRTELWTYLINCQLELQHQLPLATYLLKPVQRVLKYQLLLQECLRHLNQLVTELSKHHSSGGANGSSLKKTPSNLESNSENTNNNNNNKNGCNNSDGVDCLDYLNESVYTLRRALERMIQVADHINERKRYREFLDQLRSTRLDVDNWGDIVLGDYFRIPGKKDLRLVLLFQCALILCKYTQPSGNIHLSSTQSLSVNDNWISNTTTSTTTTTTAGTLTGPRNSLDRVGPGNSSLWNLNVRSIEIREVISCANLMLVECIDKDPLAFHILPFDNPKAQRTLQAISLETKRLWCREIKRLILENYDAAIPERAKQIVLNMAELTYGPPIKDISDLPMSLTSLQKVGTFYAGQQRNGLMNEERSASGRVHRKSDTALPRLRRLVNRSISSTNAPLASNFIRTPYPSLDEDTAEARTPPVTNGCMLNGNSKHNSRDSLSFDNSSNHGNNSTERHLDSLLHEAWEEIWAKHHSPVKPNGNISTNGAGGGVVVSPAVNGQLNPLRNTHHHNSKGGGGGGAGGETAEDDHDGTLTMNTVNEADFRCIAVEINEERFGLSSSSSPKSITSNCTVSETRKCSVSSLSKLSNTPTNHFINHSDNPKFSVPTSPSSQTLSHCSSSPSFPVCHKSSLTSNSIPTGNGITPSVYIDCPNASSYDVITFGRTYEQYIAKARAMVALSPRDLDEIFSPLRELACIIDCSENNLSPTSSSSSSTLAHRCATVPLTVNTNLSQTKQRCATSSSITKNLSRLTQGLKISLTDLSSHVEHENDTMSDGDRSNGHCSSGGSSPRHIISRIAVTHNRNTFSNDLITKTITVIPNSIPDPSFRTTATATATATATTTTTANNRSSAVRSNSLARFQTSDSKNNLNTVSDAHNGRRCSRQGSFERADSCHNGTKSFSGSPKQQLLGINNGLSNKPSVSKPPRLTNHHSTLTSVGKPVKATYNNSVDRKQTMHDSSCSTPTSPIVYDLNGRRSRRKSRAPAPPVPLGNTRPPLPHPPLKAPLAVLEGGDDVCVESVCSGHVKAVISSLSEISTKPNGLFKANSLHLKDRTTTATADDTNKGKPIKPPRRLNSTSSSSDIPHTFIKEKTAPSRNYSPTLRSLHNPPPPSSSHNNKTTATTSHDAVNQRLGIVKNMINKFQQP